MIKLKKDHFVGSSRLHGRGPDSLAAITRGLVIDATNARVASAVAATSVVLAELLYTDSSTGAAANPIPDLPLPATPVNGATGTVAATRTALATALGAADNAKAVLLERIADLRLAIGLPVASSAGTVATPGTIPAQTKTVAGAAGTSAATFASGKKALSDAKETLNRVIAIFDETLAAIGKSPLPSAMKSAYLNSYTLPAATALVATDADAASALSKADVDAFLTAHANAVASIRARWEAAIAGYTGKGDAQVVAA